MQAKRIMGRVAALVAVVALVVPATAGAKVLVETYNEGLQPKAVLGEHSAAIVNPKRITMEFTSSYTAPLTGKFKIKCDGGFTRVYKLTGSNPARRTVNMGGNKGRCLIQSASAQWVDPLLQGWIQIRATGK